jgi:hypothetical protein
VLYVWIHASSVLFPRFSVLFFRLWGGCRGETRKGGAQLAIFLVVVFLYVFLCSLCCLFCDVSCIVCVCMCAERLPPGGCPIAVKYISYKSHKNYRIKLEVTFSVTFTRAALEQDRIDGCGPLRDTPVLCHTLVLYEIGQLKQKHWYFSTLT